LSDRNSYTFHVQARDLGNPSLTSESSSVKVNVRRNQNGPVFINTPYIKALQRNASIGKLPKGLLLATRSLADPQ